MKRNFKNCCFRFNSKHPFRKLTSKFLNVRPVFFNRIEIFQNFLVSWKPPPAYTQNGEMLYYSVEYRTMYDPISKSMLVPADKTELLLSGSIFGP